MRTLDFDRVLAVIIEEYTIDGHEVIEQEGVYYARLPLNDGEHGVTVVTEQNLTRMADAIVRRVSSPAIEGTETDV
jgi:hypothetical protein